MALMGMRDVCWGFGGNPLLDHIDLQIGKDQRICLLGRNGVGKSTLLRLLAGKIEPDSGQVWRQQHVMVTCLDQEVPPDQPGSAFDIVAGGAGQTGSALVQYRRNTPDVHADDDSEQAQQVLQRILEKGDGWALQQRIEQILSRTRIDPDTAFAALSAGQKRRTLFARALAAVPDVLLLDEPTNHLDIDTITWLEDFIRRHVPTVVFVTHDRAFSKRLATTVMELDRGRLICFDGGYDNFVKRRQAVLAAEDKQAAEFDKKLSREEAWIRQGIKARRTRNQGRVRALKKMRDAVRNRRAKLGTVRLRLQEAERTGKLVIEARDINVCFGASPVIQNFSTVIMRGDRIGVIGPNGAGKTTLLRVLLGKLPPQTGSVRHGTGLQIAYFDQLRHQLDEQQTVAQNIGQGNDYIIFNGEKRHVISYLKDFLFSPDRCRTPVYVLSGGEKNRLLLARLFTRPANVLVLDEPTNDLDAETLELLEERLFEFSGTVLLVSHDRTFLNNVATASLVFEGAGRVVEYAGGYDDWLVQRPKPEPAPAAVKKPTIATRKRLDPARRRLGFKEKRELAQLPAAIEALETAHQQLADQMADPQFYKQPGEAIATAKNRLMQLEADISTAYERWEHLDGLTTP